MPYLTLKSGQKSFYYDDCFADPWTNPETILIHHGFGRNSNFWYKWVPLLARNYRVIRRDAFGHGYSEPALPKKHVNEVLDDIIDTLDQLKIEKVHWLGESTGGIFGDLVAARNPERILSLTISSSPLNFGPAGQKVMDFDRPSVNDAIRSLGVRAWGEKTIKNLNSSNRDGPPDAGFVKWWLDNWSIPSADGICAYSDIICSPEFDATPIMHKIKAPMLILAPTDSPLVDVEDQKRLAKAVGGRLELIPSHAHEIYLSQQELCQAKYLDFLASLKK